MSFLPPAPAKRKPEVEDTSSSQAEAENQCNLSQADAVQGCQYCG